MNQELIKEHFDYHDGKLIWKKMTYKSRNLIGEEAGSIGKRGYKIVSFLGKGRLVHRLIFLMHHGFLPKFLDHIDGNPLNNKIDNLREATSQQNSFNRKNKKGVSGIKNITLHKKTQKWQVHLTIGGKTKYFGLYKDIDYAKFVADAMRYKYHGKFERP